MFKEILWIVPKMDAKDLGKMDRELGKRFINLSKKFGKGLVTALSGGGLAGLGLGLVDKLLNPLKETQDAIDKVLQQGDEIVTNAKQFGTTAGKLFRLQQIAKSTGLDEGSLAVLIEKFQTAVAEAKQDPTKQTSVRQFVGDKDTAEAFFQFIQGLQKLDKNQQVIVQQEVFGEKQILKMANFLQTDFAAQTKAIGGPSAEQLTPKLENLSSLKNLQGTLESNRTLNDTFKKSQLINADMIQSQSKMEQQALDKENKQIKSYDSLAQISIASTEVLALTKDAILSLTTMLVKVTDIADGIKAFRGSRFLRGILGGSDK